MSPVLVDTEAPTRAPIRESTSARWAVLALATPVLLASLGAGIANVGLPILARAFDVPFRSVQWVVLAYLLATTALIVSVGRLADIFGRRRLLVAGLALFTLASILCGLAPALWILVVARAAQGLGAAVMTAVTMALVGDAAPGGRTGRAMGVLASMSAVGTALGPSLGGLLLAATGWRGLFLVNAPLGAVALVLARRHLPRDRDARAAGRPAFDFVGTLLLALSLGAYALAMTTGHGRLGSLELVLLLVATLGGVAFARAQARSSSPLVRLAMLRDGALGARLLTNVVASAVVMGSRGVGAFYLARGLGLAPALVGAVLSVGPLVSAVAGVPAGQVADRLGSRGATLAGLAAMGIGAVILSMLPARLGVPGYVMPIGVVTAGYSLVQTANNAAVMTGVSASRRGVVAALLGLSRNLGLITGASAMGAVFAVASRAQDVATASPSDVAAGMRATFAAAAMLVAATLVVARWHLLVDRADLAPHLRGDPGSAASTRR